MSIRYLAFIKYWDSWLNQCLEWCQGVRTLPEEVSTESVVRDTLARVASLTSSFTRVKCLSNDSSCPEGLPGRTDSELPCLCGCTKPIFNLPWHPLEHGGFLFVIIATTIRYHLSYLTTSSLSLNLRILCLVPDSEYGQLPRLYLRHRAGQS